MSIIEQEAWEKQYATEFLTLMEIPFKDIKSTSEFAARRAKRHVAGPDVKVTIEDQFGTRRIGIELTWYSSDAGQRRGSAAFREKTVRKCLRSELRSIATIPELDRFQISVGFRPGRTGLNRKECTQVAREIIDLLRPRVACEWNGGLFYAQDLSAFLELRRRFTYIYVLRTGSYRSSHNWFPDVGGFSWVGIRPAPMCHLITQHQPAKYDLTDVSECWLIIYSNGLPTSRARDEYEMEVSCLSGDSVVAAAMESDFHRVYFWSREWRWAVQLGERRERYFDSSITARHAASSCSRVTRESGSIPSAASKAAW